MRRLALVLGLVMVAGVLSTGPSSAASSERFLISPTGLDFGQVRVGESSPQQVVTVTNLGPGPVTGSMAGGAAGVFGGSQDCQGVEIPEGGSCRIFYSFTPTTVGEVTASTSGTINGQSFSFSFRGEGVQRDRFLITPTALDFGEVVVGTTSPEQTVTVTNLGPGPVTGSMAGGAAGVFGGSQDCQGVEIPEGGSCRIFYSFTPTTVGEVTASTSGTINGQPFSFSFRGVGILTCEGIELHADLVDGPDVVAPGGTYTWTVQLRADACDGLTQASAQGGTTAWTTTQASTDDGDLRVRRQNRRNQVLAWDIGPMDAGDSARATLQVTGTVDAKATCGAELQLTGQWSADATVDRPGALQTTYDTAGPVMDTVAC